LKITGFDRDAALARAMIVMKISRTKAEQFEKLTYESLDIKGRNRFAKLLKVLNEATTAEKLQAAISKTHLPREFIEAFVGLKLPENCQHAADLLQVLDVTPKTKVLKDMTLATYLERPDKTFEIMEKDFEYAKHLEFIRDIKENGFENDNMMLLCDSRETGLIALMYILECNDSNFQEAVAEDRLFIDEEYEDEFSFFDDKVLVLTSSEIEAFFQSDSNRSSNFFATDYSFQGVQNVSRKEPWWLMHSNAPIAVLLPQGDFVGEAFIEGLRLLSEERQLYYSGGNQRHFRGVA
jgi:hypothetical protein